MSTRIVITSQPKRVRPIVDRSKVSGRYKYRKWSSGLFDCCEDLESCLLAGFCSECYLCYMYYIYYEFVCGPLFMPSWANLLLRTKHRFRHNIEGDLMLDCCISYWCYPCAMCQLKRDMNHVEDTIGLLE